MRTLMLALIAALTATGCSVSHVHYRTGPAVHPELFERNVEYVFHYYPDAEVYYCPQLKIYAVYKTGAWTVVYNRPAVLQPRHRYVVIKEKNIRPWWRHTYYREASRRDTKPNTVYVPDRAPAVTRNVYIQNDPPRRSEPHGEETVVRHYTENNYYIRDTGKDDRHHDDKNDRGRHQERGDDRKTDRNDQGKDRIKDNGKDKDKDKDKVKGKDNNKDRDRSGDRKVDGRVPGYNNPHTDLQVKEVKQKPKEVKLPQWGTSKDERGRTNNGRFVQVEKEKKVTVQADKNTKRIKTESKTNIVRTTGNDKNTSGQDDGKDNRKDKHDNGKNKKNHVAAW